MADRLKILIIANARWKGGLSGGDNIYLNFAGRWPADIDVDDLMIIDCKPFLLCYIWRIYLGCMKAILCAKQYDIVYSASDFLMDSLPALILKKRGLAKKWIAGFYLESPKFNAPYRLSQFIVKPLIRRYADMIFITNSQQKHLFKNKKTVEVYGGVDFENVPKKEYKRIFDAVYCGRIHHTKGIDDLIDIWKRVREANPEAILAVIGDGDLGIEYMKKRLPADKYGVVYYGYMGIERFLVYAKSKMVLYPTRSHFSMAPVEAMACGCPMITFASEVMADFEVNKGLMGCAIAHNLDCFVLAILDYLKTERYKVKSEEAVRYAKTWDWENNAKRIYEEMAYGEMIDGI